MKTEFFKTKNSIGHIEVNDDEPESTSGGPLYPPEMEVNYPKPFVKPFPEYDPRGGSGGVLTLPGVSKDDEN